jgi:hypothetical protein
MRMMITRACIIPVCMRLYNIYNRFIYVCMIACAIIRDNHVQSRHAWRARVSHAHARNPTSQCVRARITRARAQSHMALFACACARTVCGIALCVRARISHAHAHNRFLARIYAHAHNHARACLYMYVCMYVCTCEVAGRTGCIGGQISSTCIGDVASCIVVCLPARRSRV